MVSDKLMREYLSVLTTEPQTAMDLSRKLEREIENVRRTMKVMAEIGLVEKVNINLDGKMAKPITVGYRKRFV